MMRESRATFREDANRPDGIHSFRHLWDAIYGRLPKTSGEDVRERRERLKRLLNLGRDLCIVLDQEKKEPFYLQALLDHEDIDRAEVPALALANRMSVFEAETELLKSSRSAELLCQRVYLSVMPHDDKNMEEPYTTQENDRLDHFLVALEKAMAGGSVSSDALFPLQPHLVRQLLPNDVNRIRFFIEKDQDLSDHHEVLGHGFVHPGEILRQYRMIMHIMRENAEQGADVWVQALYLRQMQEFLEYAQAHPDKTEVIFSQFSVQAYQELIGMIKRERLLFFDVIREAELGQEALPEELNEEQREAVQEFMVRERIDLEQLEQAEMVKN